jgi:hypothetical protein
MHEMRMRQFARLGDEPLTSRDGRHVLGYDDSGIATLTDTATGEIRWRAGGSGTLRFGYNGVLHTEDEGGGRLWTADLQHPDGDKMVINDDGDLELLSANGVRLVNSRTGAVEVRVLRGSAPAAAITDSAYLMRQGRGKDKDTVTRDRDGCLHVGQQMSEGYTLPPWLARWFEQDGAELTWRQQVGNRYRSWGLVLVDAAGELLWREISHDAPAEVSPSTPYAYGGHELPAGGRLWHQSLTSPNGSHTLVHQEDGNLVLYCNAAQQAVWATNTWWAGNGWADLSDGDLVVRTMYGAPLWRAGTTGATRLVVNDDGTMVLEGTSWVFDGHAGCTQPGMNTARGSTLLRGQVLQRQSLTAPDGVTVFAHRDRRLVQFAANGTCLWNQSVSDAERSYLALDDDGMLRVHDINGFVAEEIAGPADALVVTSEGVELRRDGKPFWRNGKRIKPESWDDWMSALMEDTAYCTTLIHDVEPADALRRLLGDDAKIHDGTWQDMQTLAGELDTDWEEGIRVAAFRIGDHTLLVEDNGWQAKGRPDLAAGTFAVTCYRNINAHSRFQVFRDGAVVADHSWDSGSAEPTTPEVRAALAAMGSDDPIETAFDHDLELFCRTAGVQVAVADVTGPCLYAIDAEE